MNLTILASSLDQPRIVKRIIEKAAQYETIYVYGFKREIYNVNNFDKLTLLPNVKLFIIGTISDGKYLSRIYFYVKLYFTLLYTTNLERRNFYVFGIDLNLIAVLQVNKCISYEISDILWLYKKGITHYILKIIDFSLCRMSDRVIFTSEAFYNLYYKFLENTKVEVVENRFKTFNIVKPLETIITEYVSIAYIGSFRYFGIIDNLLKYTAKNPKIKLNFYGEGADDLMNLIIDYAGNYENINYKGIFKNPDDLEKIYAACNVNFVAYDNALENERVALPNKFYESGFFNVPIVCSENTFLGEKVLKFKMGWTIAPTSKGISDFFDKIEMDNIISCHKEIKTIDKRLFSIE